MIHFGLATYGIGFAAGVLSTLSPCALPLLPILAASALSAHRHSNIVLAGGIGISFASVGIFAATLGSSIGLTDDTFRLTAAAFMVVFGLFMLASPLQKLFAHLFSSVGGRAQGLMNGIKGDSLGGQFSIGLLLGVVWSPCVGPTLGAASSLAATGRDLGQIASLMVVFGIGAALPLLILGAMSRASLARMRGGLNRFGQIGRSALGGLFVIVGALVLSGADRTVQAAILSSSPDWLVHLTTSL